MDKIKRGSKAYWLYDPDNGRIREIEISLGAAKTFDDSSREKYTGIGIKNWQREKKAPKRYFLRYLACLSPFGHIGKPCTFCGYNFPEVDKKFRDHNYPEQEQEVFSWPM